VGGVVGEQGVGAAGEGGVVVDVCLGFGGVHAGHGVAEGDPLVQGGHVTEFEPAAGGGLAEQEAGQGAGGGQLVVGENPEVLRRAAGWPVASMWASPMTTMPCRPRSAASAARASVVCGMREAWWNRGVPPSAVTIALWIPRTPTAGFAR